MKLIFAFAFLLFEQLSIAKIKGSSPELEHVDIEWIESTVAAILQHYITYPDPNNIGTLLQLMDHTKATRLFDLPG